MRKVKIVNGVHSGCTGYFHGFFPKVTIIRNGDSYLWTGAIVELFNGKCVTAEPSHVVFESQPAEGDTKDGQAHRTTPPAQNAEDSTSGVA